MHWNVTSRKLQAFEVSAELYTNTMNEMQPGTVFGRDFRILRPLRAGGMGAVYVALQLSTGKQRALKVMAHELAKDASTRERFILEARVGSHIDSDHVVEVVTAGVDEETGAPFLVMELLKGEELADVADRLGSLPLGDVAEVLYQVGHALEHAHAKGIVHRDLKPENIFLAVSRRRDTNFTVKILDFGIAKIVADQQQQGTQPLGTPLFMSPEQTERSGRIAPASDVWALGLIVFRLLTGKDFWRGADGTLPMLLREIVVDAIPLASERATELGVASKLPAGFDAWFARCVVRDIDARFTEAGAATRAFAEIVPRDAPRGSLAAAVSPGMSGTQSGTQKERAAGETVAATEVPGTRPGDATSTGASLTNAAMPSAAKSKSALFIAAGSLAVAAAGAFFIFGRGSKAPTDERPSAPVAELPRAAPSASATPPPGPSCPEGMLLIQGGNMFMGTQTGEGNASPPHRVKVSSFCLDKTEVTTSAYESCVASGNCLKALLDVQFPGMKAEQRERFKKLCNARQPGKDQHPINCVAWQMAENFCKSGGGRLQDGGARLPSEAEWEFAARGSSQRTYPWGDEAPDPTRLNACGKECKQWMADNIGDTEVMYDAEDGYPATAPVGSFPAGASHAGVLDLAGNVWEWTSDWYGPYTDAAADDPKGPESGKERVVRGGAFNGFMPDWAKPSYRWQTLPGTYNHAIGFRCAKDAPLT